MIRKHSPKIYLIVILVSFPIFVSGQESINKLEGKKYGYHSKTYKSKDLKIIFENSGDPLALEYFNKYNNKRKIRKAAFIITGSTLLIAPIALLAASTHDDVSPPSSGGSPPPSGGGVSVGRDISGYIIGGVLVAGVATIIVISSKSKSNLNQAIDQFNEGHTASLSVSVTRYGVGLNLTF